MVSNTKSKVEANFLPVFDCQNDGISAYYCSPYRTSASGTVRDEALLSVGMDERSINHAIVQENMIETIRRGVTKATTLQYEGGGEKVIIPINGSALVYKEIATEFTALCKGIQAEILQSVIFEVTNVSDDSSMSFLDEGAIILYLFCHKYSCRISPATLNFSYYATCNYSSVAFSLGNKEWPIEKISGPLRRIGLMAEASRLNVCLHGVATDEIRSAALASKIQYIDGEIVT